MTFLRHNKAASKLTNKIPRVLLCLVCIAALATVLCQSAFSYAPERILLVVMDGAPYDYCTPETMPNLHAFMQKALIFENAFSPSSWTLPAHASLFTGLYPQQHGAFRLPYRPVDDTQDDTKRRFQTKISIDNISLAEEAVTLADVLRSAGYQTLGVFGNPCYGYPIFNLNKGFDVWVNVVENKLKATGEKRRGFYSFDYGFFWNFYTVVPDASEVAGEVNRLLEAADQDKPIFLFINFEDPMGTPLYYSPLKRKLVLHNYEKYLKLSMKKIDDVLPPLLSFFKDGLVIVTSDHGQGDGKKFRPAEHGSSLDPCQTKIPLFIYNLTRRDLSAEESIDLTRIMDIILQAAGLEGAGNKMGFSPLTSAAFGHLDSAPEVPVGVMASYSVHANRAVLLLTRHSEGFSTEFVQQQGTQRALSDLLQIEKTLSDMIVPFVKLERVFQLTGKYQELDENNVEMLKGLGYIQ